MFNINNYHIISTNIDPTMPRVINYNTDDTYETIIVDGYFDVPSIIGDYIYVICSNKTSNLIVIGIKPTKVIGGTT